MKQGDRFERGVNTEPLFNLTLEKLEPIFKGWIRDVLASEKPIQAKTTFYSRTDVCKMLKISLPTLGRYMSLGIITYKKVGTRILFTQDDIDKALTALNND